MAVNSWRTPGEENRRNLSPILIFVMAIIQNHLLPAANRIIAGHLSNDLNANTVRSKKNHYYNSDSYRL